MAWVWKLPKSNPSTGYALRDDAVKAAVAHAHKMSGSKSVMKANIDPAQIETLWASLKRAGWAVYQVDI